jgi:tetratricopeptide (TPR) repeat protein
MSQIAVYAGWYAENVDGPFLDESVEFMPGALAYHLHSFSAASLRTPTRNWVAPFLSKGATLSLGCVYEPYLAGTPDIAMIVSRLYYMDFNYGQATCASQGVISWMTTVVGDPLFRPFHTSPEEIHERLVGNDDPLAEWSYLRMVNLNLAKGFPKVQAVAYLEEVPATKKSAVLTEKLADLYSELGKPSSALRSWQAALALNPSRQQRIRLQLTLGEKLAAAGQEEAAISSLTQLIKDNPDYPDAVSVYRRLVALSEELGDTARTLQYQQAIQSLTGS